MITDCILKRLHLLSQQHLPVVTLPIVCDWRITIFPLAVNMESQIVIILLAACVSGLQESGTTLKLVHMVWMT